MIFSLQPCLLVLQSFASTLVILYHVLGVPVNIFREFRNFLQWTIAELSSIKAVLQD